MLIENQYRCHSNFPTQVHLLLKASKEETSNYPEYISERKETERKENYFEDHLTLQHFEGET